jgi:hypothetical protein
MLNSSDSTNRIITTDLTDITYTNQKIDSFLPPDVKRFRVEAYLRASSDSTAQNYNFNLQIRLLITPSPTCIDQSMQPIQCVATLQTRNVPQRSYETTQFSQTGYTMNRPTGVSNVRIVIWNETANILHANGFPYVCHLHFIPIIE